MSCAQCCRLKTPFTKSITRTGHVARICRLGAAKILRGQQLQGIKQCCECSDERKIFCVYPDLWPGVLIANEVNLNLANKFVERQEGSLGAVAAVSLIPSCVPWTPLKSIQRSIELPVWSRQVGAGCPSPQLHHCSMRFRLETWVPPVDVAAKDFILLNTAALSYLSIVNTSWTSSAADHIWHSFTAIISLAAFMFGFFLINSSIRPWFYHRYINN